MSTNALLAKEVQFFVAESSEKRAEEHNKNGFFSIFAANSHLLQIMAVRCITNLSDKRVSKDYKRMDEVLKISS